MQVNKEGFQSNDDLNVRMLKNCTTVFHCIEVVICLLFLAAPTVIYRNAVVTCATNGWCDSNSFDIAIRNALVAPNPYLAGLSSHVFTFAIPGFFAFYDIIKPCIEKRKFNRNKASDFAIIFCTIAFSFAVNNFFKLTFHRQRPSFYFNQQNHTEFANRPSQEFLSFYSGDATGGFTIMTVVLLLAYLRNTPYNYKVVITCYLIATLGAILRVVGDCHWFTDAITGSVFGFVIAALYPFLLHNREKDESDRETEESEKLLDSV